MNEALFVQTSCIILSAGSSARMGTHKALLKYNAGTTFIQKIVETFLRSGIEQVIVVVNTELFELIKPIGLPETVQLVINDKPEMGRFNSLKIGVKLLTPGNSCFFQNIDNPFISSALLKLLIKARNQAEVIFPSYQDRTGHPGLFSSLVAQEILAEKNTTVRIDQFLGKFSTHYVESKDSSILININSFEEYTEMGFNI